VRAKFLLGVIGRVTPLTIAFIVAFYAPDDEAKVTSYLAGIALLIVAEYFGVYRPQLNIEDARRKILDLIFKKWLEDVRYQRRKPKLRVNVMIRKWWFGWKFFQYYQLNMDSGRDANLVFSVKQGFCGHVFATGSQQAQYRDLRKMTPEEQSAQFKWSKRQFAQTAHVKAIACTVLSKEGKSLLGAVRYRYFGVLNVDAIDDDGASFLDSEEALDDVTRLAKIAQAIFDE
jgi:hypothetical protein